MEKEKNLPVHHLPVTVPDLQIRMSRANLNSNPLHRSKDLLDKVRCTRTDDKEIAPFLCTERNSSHSASRSQLCRHRTTADCSLLCHQETDAESQSGCFAAETGCYCLEPAQVVLTAGYMETVAEIPTAEAHRVGQGGTLSQACITRSQTNMRNIQSGVSA